MPEVRPYQIFPIGDSAIVVDFGNVIDKDINDQVIALYHHLSDEPWPGLREIVPAYSSLAIYYNVFEMRHFLPASHSAYDWIRQELDKKLQSFSGSIKISGRALQVPVCYDPAFGFDLEDLAASRNLPVREVVAIHSTTNYRVFMLGFLPGFAYMGKVDPRISMSRRPEPRQRVPAGSVGIAGKQTGIYPMECPGGWQIIGRTPMKLFDPVSIHGEGQPKDGDSICLFQPGDEITFYPISKDEFESY